MNELDELKLIAKQELLESLPEDLLEDRERLSRILDNAVHELIYNDNDAFIRAITSCKRIPVTIGQFMRDPEYLGSQEYWPAIYRDLEKMCPDTWVGETQPTEVILTGAIGIAKTVRTNIALTYALYVLSCFDSPHDLFGIIKEKPIVIGCTSARLKNAKDNVYSVVRKMFLGMPYTQRHKIAYNKDKDAELELTELGVTFLVFRPDMEQIQGYDMIAASVEEANSMIFVENSKKVAGEENAVYDQAERVIHEAIMRRSSRFNRPKKCVTVGGVYVVSSANHDKDFVSKYIDKMNELGQRPDQLVFNQRAWDVWPEWKYSKETFPVLVSTKEYSGKILAEKELTTKQYPLGARIEHVPVTFLEKFQLNFEKAQRDIIGVSSTATDVFIKRPEFIRMAMKAYSDNGFKSFTDRQNYDVGVHGMPMIIESNLPSEREKAIPRVVHTDLAVSGDKCGIAMSRVLGRVNEIILDEDEKTVVQERSMFVTEMSISLQGSKGIEVDIEQVVNFIVKLKKQYGLNIVMFSFDRWQSAEARQRIRKLGFKSTMFSSNDKPESYDFYRDLLYGQRLLLPNNEELFEESIHLQKNEKTGKVDHAPGFHNDICDAVVSSVYQLTTVRAIRSKVAIVEDGRKVRDGATITRRNIKRNLD